MTAPGVLQNDADNDSDPLTLTVLDDVQHGILALAQDGSFTWTPNADFAGTDSFTYRVSDGIASAVATVQLTATGISSVTTAAPTAKNDYYDTTHSQTLSVSDAAGVMANDSDPDGDALSATLLVGPSHGQLTFNTDGSFVYAPEASGVVPYTGTDSFTYQVTDGTHSTTATVEIGVANTLPWAVSTAFDVHQGEELTTATSRLTRFAGDVDSDTLSFVKLSDPASGTLTFLADGSFSYVPDVGFTGTDSFNFHVTDAVGHSQTATVTLDVLNHRPSALDLDFRTQHDTLLAETGRGVLAGAADRDGDDLTASLATSPQNGTVTLNADGSFEYTPAAGFSGTDEFRFRVFDGAEYSYESVVTIQVDNQAPTVLPGSGTTKHGQIVPLLLTAFDTDGDALTYELTAAPQHGSLVYDNPVNDGTDGQPVTFTGAVSWQPNAGYVGDDSFDFRVTDGVAYSEAATVSLKATNFTPQASPTLQSTLPGQSVTVDSPGLLIGASDGDGDVLTLEVVDQPLNGSITLATIDGVPTGGYTYTPNAGFADEDTFTWRVYDGAEWSDPAAVTIDVRNSTPLLSSGSLRTVHGQGVDSTSGRSYSFDLNDVANAVDPDQDMLTYEITTQAEHGIATLSSSGTLIYTSTSTTFTGQDEFSIRVSDGYSFSEPTTVVVEITNTQPTANDSFQSITHSDVLTLTAETLLANAVDFDGDTLQLVSVETGDDGVLTEADGVYSFNPNGFIGTTQLTYVVSDGLATSEPASIEVSVSDLQVWALSPVITTESNGTASFDLLGAAGGVVNPDEAELSVQIVTPPTAGTLVSDGGGSFTYSRAAGSTAADSFEYRLTAGSTAGSVITAYIEESSLDLTFDIAGQFGFTDQSMYYSASSGFWLDESAIPITYHDTAPIAVAAAYRFDHGDRFHSGQLNIPQPGANDFDPDGDLISTPGLSYDGSWAAGDYHFDYSPVANGVAGGPATYCVEVLNYAPVGMPDMYFVMPPDSSIFDYEGIDPERDPTTYTVTANLSPEGTYYHEMISEPGHDSLSLSYQHQSPLAGVDWTEDIFSGSVDDGTYQYVTTNYRTLHETISWSVTETTATAESVSGTFHIAVTEDPDFRWNVVVAQSDLGQWHGQVVTGNVLANDFSADWDTLTVVSSTITKGSSAGTIAISADGSYVATVTAPEEFLNSNGMTAEYTVEDEYGNQTTSELNIKLRVLRPGQSASHDGVSVINGTKYDGSGTYFTGVTDVGVYIDGEAHVFLPSPAVAKFDVNGGGVSIHGAGGDQVWVNATGDINFPAPMSILHANLNSEFGNVGDFEAGTARVTAGGDIGNVNAGLIVSMTAGGSVGHVEGGIVQHISAGSDIASVSSLGYINSVTAGGGIGAVEAATWINTISAGTQIVSVQAGKDIGIDGAAGTNSIGGIFAGGVLGDVTAGGLITKVHAGQAILGNIQAGGGPGHHIYSVTAGTFPQSWGYSQSASGPGHILGDVTAGGSIGEVAASGYILGNISAGSDGSIGQVVSYNTIDGNVSAGQHIGLVEAGTNLTGNVQATNGNIIRVVAAAYEVNDIKTGSINNSSINAALNIGSVQVLATEDASGILTGGDLNSEITATDGFIRVVSATATIDSKITAKQSIDEVTAGIDINKDITSEESYVAHVSAAAGSIKGDVKAETRIGGVFAFLDIEGDITAVTSHIESVTTSEGDIEGEVKADTDIGTLSAGRDIKKDVTATNGSIGHVLAGTAIGGSILGDVTAGQSIGIVEAIDQTARQFQEAKATTSSANWYADYSSLIQYIGNQFVVNKPAKPAASPRAVSGNISGKLTAQTHIGGVIGDGSVTGAISVGTYINKVAALSDVESDITSTVGSLQVVAGGEQSGKISTTGSVSVNAFDGIAGEIISSGGALYLNTLGALTGTLVAAHTISGSAFEDIKGAFTSIAGSVSLTGLGDIIVSNVMAHKGLFMFNLGLLDLTGTSTLGAGTFLSVGDSITSINYGSLTSPFNSYRNIHTIKSFGNIDTTSTWANKVEVVGWGDVKINASAFEDVTIQSLGNVDMTMVLSEQGNIVVEAASVEGMAEAEKSQTASGAFGHDGGSIIVRALGTKSSDGPRSGGDVNITARAAKRLSVSAYGDVAGVLRSTLSSSVSAMGTVSARIRAGADLFDSTRVVAGEDVTGRITAESSTSVTAIGDIKSMITVAPDASDDEGSNGGNDSSISHYIQRQDLSISAGGNVNGALKAFGDIRAFVGGDFTGDGAKAGDDFTGRIAGTMSATVKAGADPTDFGVGSTSTLGNTPELSVHIASIVAHSGTSSEINAKHGIDLVSFGTISGDLTATAGSIVAAAHVNTDLSSGGASSPTPGNVTGKIDSGDRIELQATGNVTSTTIKGKGDIQLAAHGDISGVDLVDSESGYVAIASDGNVNIAKTESEVFTDIQAVESIEGALYSTGEVSAWAGTDIEASGSSTNGTVSFTAIGNIEGTGSGLKGSKGVFVVAHDSVSNVEAESSEGEIHIYAQKTIADSKANAGGEVVIVGLEGVTGTGSGFMTSSTTSEAQPEADFTSTASSVSVTSLKDLTSVGVSASTAADAYAAGNISGGFLSRTAVASVVSAGVDPYATATSQLPNAGLINSSSTANVEGRTGVRVTAFGGGVSGNLNSDYGHVTVLARGAVSSKIDAGTNVSVTAGGAVGGTSTNSIDANGNASVSSFGSVNSVIVAYGSASVTAGTSIDGSIKGEAGASASTLTGEIGAEIESANGSVNVFSGAGVTGEITAHSHFSGVIVGGLSGNVVATYGDIDATVFESITGTLAAGNDVSAFAGDGLTTSVTAGRDVNLNAFGTVDGSLTAGRNITGFASDSVKGQVEAGKHVSFFSGGQFSASADAGENIDIKSLSSISGPVDAGEDAWVWAGGSIETQVTAGDHAGVIAWNTHSGMVLAGKSAFVFVADAANSVIDAGEDATLISWGDATTALLDAGRDAAVIVTGTVAGAVTSGRDALVVALNNITTPIFAGRDAFVFSTKEYGGVLIGAGRDAGVIIGGNFEAGLTAGRDAFVYSFGGGTGAIEATGYVGAVFWDTTSGPFIVSGDLGASLSTISAYTGNVSSSAGNAHVVTMGSFVGDIFAGQTASLSGEGSLTFGSITGGSDVHVWLWGDINGSISSGRDAWLYTYGGFDGSISADRDVRSVYTFGDLTASIIAGEMVRGWSDDFQWNSYYSSAAILSHGEIDASVHAGTIDPLRGYVGSIVALSDISGSVSATQDVGTIRSGGIVTVYVNAPTGGAIIENDSTVVTDYPVPQIPASELPNLLQFKDGVIAKWETDQNALIADLNQSKLDIDNAIQDALDDFARLLDDLQGAKLQVQTDMADGLVDGKQDFEESLDDSRRELLEDGRRIITSAIQDMNEAQATLTRIINAGNDAYDESVQEAVKGATELQLELSKLNAELSQAKITFDADATKSQAWTQEIIHTAAQLTNVFEMVRAAVESVVAGWNTVSELAQETEFSDGFHEAYFYVGNMFPGIRKIQGAWDGRDPWTLEKISTFDRIFQGVTGILDVASVVLGVGRLVNSFAAPCRAGWIFGTCFVGDTAVVIAPLPYGASVAAVGPTPGSQQSSAEEPSSWGNVCLILGIGSAITAYGIGRALPVEERKRRKRKESLVDQLFCTDGGPELLDDPAAKAECGVPDHALTASVSDASASPMLDEYDSRTVNKQDATSAPSTSNKETGGSTLKPITTTRIARGFGVLAAILLALGMIFTFRDAEPSAATYLSTATAEFTPPSNTPVVPKADEGPNYLTVPIRDLQVMHHRVMAHNPLREEVTESLGDIDPLDWRVVRLQYDNPDGSRVFIERGMPLEEIELERFDVGDVIPVSLPESGIEGEFVVTDILPCPEPAAGDGQLVITKFIHENAEVYDVKVEGSSETIGTTATHRFWSEDRHDFVPIAEFQIGEELELANGTLARLESLRPRSHLETVYNIEVDSEHVYRVGPQGVLVHNACDDKLVYLIRNKKTGVVKYVGITGSYDTRKLIHLASRKLRRGEEMVAVTKKIKHAHARSLESQILYGFVDKGRAAGLHSAGHQIWYQLKKSGLRNANRGRLSSRWGEGVEADIDVFDNLIPGKVGSSLKPIGY